MLCENSNKKPIILHSDQWSEYRSYEYLDLLKRNDIQVSMSRKSSPSREFSSRIFLLKV